VESHRSFAAEHEELPFTLLFSSQLGVERHVEVALEALYSMR
jgi:hypothetical protein